MNRKRIAIVINSLKLGGGAEKVATTLGSELNERGYGVVFLVFQKAEVEYKFKGDYLNIGKDIKIKNSFGAFWAIFRRAKKIQIYCRNNDISTLISFMEEANFASIVSKIFFKNKAKVLVSVREDPRFKKKIAKILMKILHPGADKVVANSQKAEKVLQENFGIKKTVNIYNPLDFDKILKLKTEAISPEEEVVFSSGFIFVNIGRLTRQKGQLFLLDSFKEVCQTNPRAKLVIIGEGELKKILEARIEELSLRDKVFLLEGKDNVYKYLARSDCFVSSSIWEGLPNTLIEALAVGLPLISTDCLTGPREIIAPDIELDKQIGYPYQGKFGYLVKTKENYLSQGQEKEILSQAMKSMIKEKDKFIFSRKDLAKFELDSVVKKWEDLIIN